MPQLKFSRSVPYSADQMIDLVSDLNAYPDFVPNCSDMKLSGETGVPLDTCNARMHISFGPVNQSYTSRVTIDRKAGTVSARALDGPFAHLDSKWTFRPEENGTKVRFEIDFEIANPLIRAVAEPAFSRKQGEILDAFVREAHRRYGKALQAEQI